uniref:Uncharacterized protein n=1 Tax=Glossina palpalis gambiensis TaxID=67801 RepID=A0A1B0BLD4_9MUSC
MTNRKRHQKSWDLTRPTRVYELLKETITVTRNDSDSEVEAEIKPTDMTDGIGTTNMNKSIPTTPCETARINVINFDWASTSAAAGRVKENRRHKVSNLDISTEALKKVIEMLTLHDNIVQIYFDDVFANRRTEQSRMEDYTNTQPHIKIDKKDMPPLIA